MKKIIFILVFLCQFILSLAQNDTAKVSIISWNIDASQKGFVSAMNLDIDSLSNDLKEYLTFIIESKFQTDSVVYAIGMNRYSDDVYSYKSINQLDKKIMKNNPSKYYMKVFLYYTYPKKATISPNVIVTKLSLRIGFFDNKGNLMWELKDRTAPSTIVSDFGNKDYYKPDIDTYKGMYNSLKFSFQEKAL